MLPPFQLVQGGQFVRKYFVLHSKGNLGLLFLLLLHCIRELLVVVCLQVVSSGFGGSLGKPWWPRLNLRWLIFISKWWFLGVIFGWVVLAQKTLCNGAIKIVSQVSPNFGCLFFRNNAVVLDGGHGYRLKRWICSDYISILSQHYLNNITFIFVYSVPLHKMELHKMTKELALRP